MTPPENSLTSWEYEVLQVERWWKVDSPDWSIIDYANKQEFMFVQDRLLSDSYKDEQTDDREEWKGPDG